MGASVLTKHLYLPVLIMFRLVRLRLLSLQKSCKGFIKYNLSRLLIYLVFSYSRSGEDCYWLYSADMIIVPVGSSGKIL